MRAPDLMAGALGSLLAHPLRSLLTVVGVVTGVGAVIVVISASEGSRRQVLNQLELLGSRTLIALSGPVQGSGRPDALDRADAEAIEREIPGARVSPEVLARATVGQGRKTLSVPVAGVTPAFVGIRNFQLESGAFFSAGEDRGRARVCVLGSRTASQLFPGQSAPGKTIKLDGVRYEVKGVFAAKGDLGWFHPDEMVAVPLATAQERILGINYVHAIAVDCPPSLEAAEVADRVVALLRRRHGLAPGLDKEHLDFHLINQREMIEAAAEVSRTLTALLVSLAAVSLVTGGVGIMNIMMVSVTERTSEIGIRKAVGATAPEIFFQFLLESVVLSGAGAAVGVMAGMTVSVLLSGWGGWEPVFTVSGVAISVAVALAVGLVFGIYPALRAAALEPVEALRA